MSNHNIVEKNGQFYVTYERECESFAEAISKIEKLKAKSAPKYKILQGGKWFHVAHQKKYRSFEAAASKIDSLSVDPFHFICNKYSKKDTKITPKEYIDSERIINVSPASKWKVEYRCISCKHIFNDREQYHNDGNGRCPYCGEVTCRFGIIAEVSEHPYIIESITFEKISYKKVKKFRFFGEERIVKKISRRKEKRKRYKETNGQG
jgi:DNA-directed RNA polymerase subunit RPC12/RpoP